MSLTVEVNGTAIVDAIQPSSVGSQMRAEDGDVGFSGFLVDDPAAAITTTGHKVVTVEESECSQPRLFTGYLTDRNIARSLTRGMIAGDDARVHEATCVDLNAVFSFRIITTTGGKRPEESMEDRLTWLLGYQALSVFVEDTGFVEYYPQMMDEADYTGATPAAVLDDLVGRIPDPILTYFAFWDATAGAVGLYFGPEADGIGESSLSISNDLADINGTTVFAPDAEAKLRRTPEEVYSEVICEYLHGTKRVYRKRPDTATAYVARGTTIQRPYTGRLTTAQNQADRWLTKHSVEQDEVTVAIIVPPASAGLALAGQRINCKFTHLPGYEAWTSMRIVTSTVTPLDDTATQYRVELVLRLPTAGSAPSAECDGTAGSSAIYGITPTYANTAGLTEVPTNLSQTTNGNMLDYSFWNLELAGAGTWVRDYIFTLPAPVSLSAVTASVEWYGLGIGTYDEALDKFSIVLDGTTVYDSSYATKRDRDIWTYMDDPGTPDLYYASIATWRFDTADNVSEVRLRCTDVHASLQALKTIRLNEIAFCAFDADEQEDLAETPTSPVITDTDPTVNDDANDGYTPGQVWVNTSTGDVFILTDSTVGAAVWTEVSGAGVSDHGALTGLADDDHTQYVLKRYGGKEVVNTVAAAGATETLDLADGNVHDVTLDADCTLTFTGATNGVACSFTLLLRQDGTGGWTTTWPGSVVWADGSAPTLDETAATVSVLTFFTLDGGVTWFGFPTGGSGVAGGTPALTFGTTNAQGAASTAVLTDATIAIFDATSPTTLAFGGSAATGSAAFAARRDHSHGMPAEPTSGGIGPILISDTPSTPLVFADLIQNEAQDDLVYADP